MGQAPGSVAQWDGSGQRWFKIAEWGATFNPFTFTSLNQKSLTTIIPKSTPSGEYLVRAEQIGLHNPGSPEIFVSCAQVRVINGGSGNPPKVSMPGYIPQGDESVILNVYWPVPHSSALVPLFGGDERKRPSKFPEIEPPYPSSLGLDSIELRRKSRAKSIAVVSVAWWLADAHIEVRSKDIQIPDSSSKGSRITDDKRIRLIIHDFLMFECLGYGERQRWWDISSSRTERRGQWAHNGHVIPD
ncbi:hypothetical protein NP233_g4225 [Leucocoprinus birnbaumii]|uniref:AA9 family lytic polysaccharide monooxygenase n=1 Tax=Leucocoprinus birnbaumii TaxID=56174 RepID=A0AAD5VYT3_9AGAR|nr:hypothetical protein NP233_g4225 [Leucocoprinus birnbaumii]